MGLNASILTTAEESAFAPTDKVHDNDQTALFADPGDGSDQKKDGHAVFEEVADPNSKEQETLYKFGNKARDNFNKDALTEAQSGELIDKNLQYGSNIPIESPFANYNNLSWEDTQRLSRLADAYNNRHRLQPGQTGTDAASRSMGQFVRNDPIETEEMRRMDMTRQGLSQQQSMALGRANDILAYPQKLTEMFDKMGMDADAAAMEIQRNFADYAQRAQYDEKFRSEYEQALQKGLLYWTQEMQQFQGSKVAAVLYNEMSNNPQYAQWVAAQLVSAPLPSQQQYLANMITSQIQRSSMLNDADPQTILSQVEAVLAKLTGYESYQSQLASGYGWGQSIRGSAAGTGSAFSGNFGRR